MYTKGQWEARRGDVLNPNRSWGIVIPLSFQSCVEIDGDASYYGARTEVIAEVCSGPTDKADARLIAAAPDLLEACKFALDELSEMIRSYMYPVLQETLEDAIKKATE